jgi:hypothetical protein
MEKLEKYKELKNDDILRSMIDYMNFDEGEGEFDCGYSQKDIDSCGNILDNYIDQLVRADKSEKIILKSVKKVILELNRLNEKCNHMLIETDQREYLCPFIEDLAIIAGLSIQKGEDITLEWREW